MLKKCLRADQWQFFLDRPIRAQKLWDGTSAQLKGLLPALFLLITAHHFFLSLRKREMGRHSRTVALRNDLLCPERLISRNKKKERNSPVQLERGAASVQRLVNENTVNCEVEKKKKHSKVLYSGFIVETSQQRNLYTFTPAQNNYMLRLLIDSWRSSQI